MASGSTNISGAASTRMLTRRPPWISAAGTQWLPRLIVPPRDIGHDSLCGRRWSALVTVPDAGVGRRAGLLGPPGPDPNQPLLEDLGLGGPVEQSVGPCPNQRESQPVTADACLQTLHLACRAAERETYKHIHLMARHADHEPDVGSVEIVADGVVAVDQPSLIHRTYYLMRVRIHRHIPIPGHIDEFQRHQQARTPDGRGQPAGLERSDHSAS